jgi:hypothetical protein
MVDNRFFFESHNFDPEVPFYESVGEHECNLKKEGTDAVGVLHHFCPIFTLFFSLILLSLCIEYRYVFNVFEKCNFLYFVQKNSNLGDYLQNVCNFGGNLPNIGILSPRITPYYSRIES